MSFRAMKHARDRLKALGSGTVGDTGEEMNPTDRLVLLILADYANNQTGLCNPSNASLQKETGLKSRHITSTFQKLHRLGFLTIEEREGRSHRFWLPPFTPAAQCRGSESDTPAAQCIPTPAAQCTQTRRGTREPHSEVIDLDDPGPWPALRVITGGGLE